MQSFHPEGKMRSGVRWKSREAAAVALGEPISSLYKEMQEWEPLEALLADSSVILSTNVSKAQVLNRACFGKPIYAATSPHECAASIATRSPRLPEVDAEPEDLRMFQFGLEEAFFLISELKCISIYRQTIEGREVLSEEEVWRCMQASRPEFGYLYMAYAHLRSKNWVVRSGIQYGADFMAYRHHPALVHSDYSVIVIVEGQQERLKTWTEVQAMNRLCGSVAKTLLQLHIISKSEAVDLSSPLCQSEFTVEAVEVRRWLPEKNREENCSTCQPVGEQNSSLQHGGSQGVLQTAGLLKRPRKVKVETTMNVVVPYRSEVGSLLPGPVSVALVLHCLLGRRSLTLPRKGNSNETLNWIREAYTG